MVGGSGEQQNESQAGPLVTFKSVILAILLQIAFWRKLQCSTQTLLQILAPKQHGQGYPFEVVIS